MYQGEGTTDLSQKRKPTKDKASRNHLLSKFLKNVSLQIIKRKSRNFLYGTNFREHAIKM